MTKKIMTLSVSPKSWSVFKLQAEFVATGICCWIVKKSSSKRWNFDKPKQRECLSKETIQLVCEFFKSDSVSHMMHGKKECVSIKINGVQEKI